MADGPFYLDTREPFFVSDLAAVTLAATDKALHTPSQFPVLGGQYFARPGKRAWLHAFGKITTAVTPGNGSFSLYYGTGADANGVLLAASTPVALSASQTGLSWEVDLFIRCISIGSTGTLRVDGSAKFNNAVIASTLQPILIPANLAVDSAACDLTSPLILSLQFKRSGSTVETMTMQDMHFVPMN